MLRGTAVARRPALFGATPPLLVSKPFLTSPFPLRRRPDSMKRGLGLPTIDDQRDATWMMRHTPHRVLHAKNLIMKECPNCRRTQMFTRAEKDYYHNCCENEVMVFRGSYQKAQEHVDKLLSTARRHDFDAMRPRDNWHNKPSRATS